MAKLKVEWTSNAKIELSQILENEELRIKN